MSTTAVRDDPANKAPTFTEGEATVRYVNENNTVGTPESIGDPVTATDPDGESVSYELGGTDGNSFDIDGGSGQLMTKARLDHETEDSYTVEVTASDNSGAANDSATITVTIRVMDLDEQPVISKEATGAPAPANNAPEFPATEDGARSVAENTAADMNIGAPVSATDADEGDTLTYTLGGADAASFDIDSTTGQLKTKAALDYETKTTYEVTVMADDGNDGTDTIDVTVTVTDVEETGTGTVVEQYDADKNGEIDDEEVLDAVDDYFEVPPKLTREQILDIVDFYFDQF